MNSNMPGVPGGVPSAAQMPGVHITVNPTTGEVGIMAMGIPDPLNVLALLNDAARAVLGEIGKARHSQIVTANVPVPRNDSGRVN